MLRTWICIILFILFLIEGALTPWLPLKWNEGLHITPHFTFIIILYTCFYVQRSFAIIIAFLIGFFYDIIYSNQLFGLYAFCLGFIVYFISYMIKRSYLGFFTFTLVATLSLFLLDSMIYGIYYLFKLTEQSYIWVIAHQVLPSLFVNVLFSMMLYLPFRSLVVHISFKQKG
ncbi:rod shape-determining protein MreD [Chengkuizengella axinellae]|uniref:Rod shape-determining protein MreD n=1 Tax=Chengkuizengella axinellae TaxID=3064388 RepID=A0ABT9IV50_9BACL|nr:rod shape-determining protein MreD [Chengkuizengella sp. 2205SS18-9]MDP5272729.1 rod shape-determining protein MreD [Chengkuizengella sp. 2205SS18-9]